jgi:hypothetical protein
VAAIAPLCRARNPESITIGDWGAIPDCAVAQCARDSPSQALAPGFCSASICQTADFGRLRVFFGANGAVVSFCAVRNTLTPLGHTRASRGAEASELMHRRGPSKTRAQGKPGADCTHSLVRNKQKRTSLVTTGSVRTGRPSLRDGFNGFFRGLLGGHAVPPSIRGVVMAHVPGWVRQALRNLDASIGASGPHDFTVRSSNVVVLRVLIAHRSDPLGY